MEEEKKVVVEEGEEGGAHSLLCKVRSDGEAGGPQCSHAKHRLDGGPGAAEERVPLSVIELHEGILGDRQTDRQTKGEYTFQCMFSNIHGLFLACFIFFGCLLSGLSNRRSQM